MSRHQSSEEVKEQFEKSFPNGSGELAYWLWNDISLLHMNWNSYGQLFASDVETIDLLNSIAPPYFAMTERTLRRDTLLRICRILDPPFFGSDEDKPNASLSQLLIQVRGKLPTEILQEIESKISELRIVSKPIRDLRNKRFAHSDLKEVLKLREEPLPGVSRNLVEEVLAGIREIFNSLEDQFRDSATSFDFVSQLQGAKTLLFHLKRAIKYQEIEQLGLRNQYGG
jgi:hypothetical protein